MVSKPTNITGGTQQRSFQDPSLETPVPEIGQALRPFRGNHRTIAIKKIDDFSLGPEVSGPF